MLLHGFRDIPKEQLFVFEGSAKNFDMRRFLKRENKTKKKKSTKTENKRKEKRKRKNKRMKVANDMMGEAADVTGRHTVDADAEVTGRHTVVDEGDDVSVCWTHSFICDADPTSTTSLSLFISLLFVLHPLSFFSELPLFGVHRPYAALVQSVPSSPPPLSSLCALNCVFIAKSRDCSLILFYVALLFIVASSSRLLHLVIVCFQRVPSPFFVMFVLFLFPF